LRFDREEELPTTAMRGVGSVNIGYLCLREERKRGRGTVKDN
jgi:hypothetical protein